MIDKADQERIAFAEQLLASGEFANTIQFNSPEFLSCAVKHGLLKGTSSLEEAYEVFGKLIYHEYLYLKRREVGLIEAIDSLSAKQIRVLREFVSGVVPFTITKPKNS